MIGTNFIHNDNGNSVVFLCQRVYFIRLLRPVYYTSPFACMFFFYLPSVCFLFDPFFSFPVRYNVFSSEETRVESFSLVPSGYHTSAGGYE
jgi:hypothetical protein